jgi:ubiquinone/menaquinone biosynthesis C-methylase UbiE
MLHKDQLHYWLDERHLQYHRKQFETPYRSTVALGDILKELAIDAPDVLDVACGAGANIAYLTGILPRATWTGVDFAEELFPIGMDLMKQKHIDPLPTLVKGDMLELKRDFGNRQFDITLSLQTLSWLPAYEPYLAQLFAVTKSGGHIIISSLFTDTLADARIEIIQYVDKFCNTIEGQTYYNIYCIERFIHCCNSLGANSCRVVDFNIDIDLPKPTSRKMGTYTEKLSDDRRIQISGPLLMPWAYIVINVA